jgi:hypothetical protein
VSIHHGFFGAVLNSTLSRDPLPVFEGEEANCLRFNNGGPKKEKALLRIIEEGLWKNPGGVLLSHTVTHAVPSALEDLTSVFGMGTGVTPPLSPPKTEKR